MRYGQYIDTIIDRLKLDRNDIQLRSTVGLCVNSVYKEIGNNAGVDWKRLERIASIRTVPNVTSGTCTYTKDNRIVTFAGVSVSRDWEGRFFQPQDSDNWYQIVYADTSSNALTLDKEIIEDSASGKSHKIWKRYYYMPSEVKKIVDVESFVSDGILVESSNRYLHEQVINYDGTGTPENFIMGASNVYRNDYSAGTVSGTQNSNILSGSGTAWLSNVEAGDELEVNNVYYRVKIVRSDTSMELYNYLKESVLSNSTYTVRKRDNICFQLFYNPSSAIILPYIYQKRVFSMINENYDFPEFPEEFDYAILDGSEAEMLSIQAQDTKWANKLAVYQGRIRDLKNTRFVSSPRTTQMRPLINDRGGY